MRLQQACLPYLIVVSVVMTIYSMFLLHLTKSFRPPFDSGSHLVGGSEPSRAGREGAGSDPPGCACTPTSLAELEANRGVVMGLSFPYRYFNSNHWFHISEYYVSRHMRVAPKLPPNATVYIVAPHELFVPNLIPMTFFLLLLAFTDGTAQTAEVLPRRALAQLAITGDVLALDNGGVESYVYDASLPPFRRTRRYEPGERHQQDSRGLAVSPEEKAVMISEEVSVGVGTKAKDATGEAGEAAAAVSGSTWDDLLSDTVDVQGDNDLISTSGQRRGLDERSGGGGADVMQQRRLEARQRVVQGPWEEGATVDVEGERRSSIDGSSDRRRREKYVSPDEDVDEIVGSATSAPPPDQNPPRAPGARPDASENAETYERRLAAATIASVVETAPPDENDSLGGAENSRADQQQQQQPRQQRQNEEGMASAKDFPPVPTAKRTAKPCACARYIGEFGAAPVERGYWFREEKVENTRARIDSLCGDIYRRRRQGLSTETGAEGEGEGGGVFASSVASDGSAGAVGGGNTSRRRQRLVIYQRNTDRRLLDLEGNVETLRELLGPDWDLVPIVHDNAHEPCWLYSQLMDADMLLTPHGFQSMLLLFLPPGAVILEVFPYKYWKEGYAPLAEEWGVRHEHIMSRPVSWAKRLLLFFIPLERCMRDITCRKWSRGADVLLEEHHLRQIAKAAKEASTRKEDFLAPPAPVAPSGVRRQR